MTKKEIYEEIGSKATKISKELFGEDIMDLKTHEQVAEVIRHYKKIMGSKSHPELTTEFLWKFITGFD